MAKLIRFVLGHRALVGVVLILSLAVALFSARTIRLRFQFRDLFDYPSNPHLALFKQDNEEFGDPAGYVVAMIDADDVFRRDVLEYVQRLTNALEPEKIFGRVRSLTNAHAVRGEGDDVLSGPLMPTIPDTPEAIAPIKSFVLQSPLLLRRLVSRDGKTTAVLAEMRNPATFSSVPEQREALDVVERALSNNPPPNGVKVRVTGAPAVEVGVTESLIKDQTVLMPAVMSVLFLMLYLMFRSFHGILLCMAAINVATIWTAGLFALAGRPVDIIGSVIPTTILVYGSVDPIFVLTRVLNKSEAGMPKEEAIVQAFSELGLPCFLTSLTTALGFASFVTARAPTIQAYGLTVAVGVLLAWVTTITVLPLLLSLAPLPKAKLGNLGFTRLIDRWLQSAWGFLRGHLPHTVAVTVIALVVGGFLARKQHIDNVYVGGLPRGQTQEDVRTLEKRLAGVVRLIVHLEGAPDSMKQPAVLKAIESVDRSMEKQPLVTVSTSLADLVAEANQAFHGGDAAEHSVPESRSLIAQYMTLVDPIDRTEFVTDDYSKSHIAMLLRDTGSEDARALVAQLQSKVDAAGFERLGVKATLTGNGVVAYREIDGVVIELLWGFITAFAIIVALEWLLFRSLRIALLSVAPNVLPVIACFLTLRLFNIHLKIDNALVLCISIGGLFNTTIHLAARLIQRVAEGESDPDAVVLHAMTTIGPAALFTAATLSAGFSVLLLSSFPGLQGLGLLSMVTLMIGFLCDMLITPVLFRLGFDWARAIRRSASSRPPAAAAIPAIGPSLD